MFKNRSYLEIFDWEIHYITSKTKSSDFILYVLTSLVHNTIRWDEICNPWDSGIRYTIDLEIIDGDR